MTNVYVPSLDEAIKWDLEVRACFSKSTFFKCISEEYFKVNSGKDIAEKARCVEKSLKDTITFMNEGIQYDDCDSEDNSCDSMYSMVRDYDSKPTPKFTVAQKNRMELFVMNLQYCHPLHHNFRIVGQKE